MVWIMTRSSTYIMIPLIYLLVVTATVLCDDDIVRSPSSEQSKGERSTRQIDGIGVSDVAVDSEAASAIMSAAAMSLRPEARHLLAGSADHCVLHKGVLHQGPFPQYIMYKSHIPDLKEFTLCHWHKFYNHSTDHPIFTYSARGGKAGEVRSWVSNNFHSSFYQLAINGHTIYRLNYPLRLHKWYHACQSWNGRTGEWQIWVNSERVGRGFYNLVVGKVIKGGGSAITGQDTKSYGQGYMGEVTLLMLYKAALTAGKAYYNHKHHHAHKFHHDDKLGEDDPENTAGGTRVNLGSDVLAPQVTAPLLNFGPGGAPGEGPKKEGILIGMQLEPRLPVEELAISKPGLNLLKAADILGPFSNLRLYKREQNSTRTPTRRGRSNKETSVADSQGFESKKTESTTDDNTRKRRRADDMVAADIVKMETIIKSKDPKKRTAATSPFGIFSEFDLSNFYGGKGSLLGSGGFVQSNGFPSKLKTSSPSTHSDDNYVEPAEWEVKSVMSLCSACGEDPFRKANVLSWQESPKKLAAGALFVEANQQCHQF